MENLQLAEVNDFYRQEMAEAPKTEVPALDEVRFGGCFI